MVPARRRRGDCSRRSRGKTTESFGCAQQGAAPDGGGGVRPYLHHSWLRVIQGCRGLRWAGALDPTTRRIAGGGLALVERRGLRSTRVPVDTLQMDLRALP